MQLLKSYISLTDLRFHAYHGVLEQERMVGNDYIVDLRLEIDLSKAMATDNLSDTINYAEVYNRVKEEMQKPHQLLEKVVDAIGQCVFDNFKEVVAIDIKLTKLNPPFGADCRGAGVEVYLKR